MRCLLLPSPPLRGRGAGGEGADVPARMRPAAAATANPPKVHLMLNTTLMIKLIHIPLLAILALGCGAVAAQGPALADGGDGPKGIPLYSGTAPGSEGWDWRERTEEGRSGPIARDVVEPVLLRYPADPAKAVGTAMIVAPGGGFRGLMMSYEGEDVAKHLSSLGIEAFVLKYRLLYTGPGAVPPQQSGDTPAFEGRPRRYAAVGAYKSQAGQDVAALAGEDARQAVRVLRERAAELGVQPNRIGMMGFSAGGAVAARTLFGPADSRPDFVVIIYGVGEVGEMPEPKPPLFIATAADDKLAVDRAVDLFTAYHRAGGPAELHVWQTGGHGFQNHGGGADRYLDRLEEWLRVNGLLSKPAEPAR